MNFPVLLDETRYQWQQSISKQTGRHYFKFGADINYLKAHTSFPVNFAGTFTFSSLADFVAGRVNAFSQGFGNPEIRLPEKMLGFYAQDSFKLHPTLTLTYGLRYDYDMQPQNVKRDRSNPIEASLQDGINRDPNNWAPRLGINWNPDGKGKTSIRAGFGMFYDKIFLLVARNALISRQTLSLTATQATAQVTQRRFPAERVFPDRIRDTETESECGRFQSADPVFGAGQFRCRTCTGPQLGCGCDVCRGARRETAALTEYQPGAAGGAHDRKTLHHWASAHRIPSNSVDRTMARTAV